MAEAGGSPVMSMGRVERSEWDVKPCKQLGECGAAPLRPAADDDIAVIVKPPGYLAGQRGEQPLLLSEQRDFLLEQSMVI